MPDHLHHLERHSIHLIRETCARLQPPAVLWSLGKDSTTRADERAGRAMDHKREDAFERLRAVGYM
jgi:3'-phosphoadenosine 5'-phosphosulfate sulfotransferase (PAPS reductase)/FAD synthetase